MRQNTLRRRASRPGPAWTDVIESFIKLLWVDCDPSAETAFAHCGHTDSWDPPKQMNLLSRDNLWQNAQKASDCRGTRPKF
jgi:hypothetical protein